MKVLAGTCLSVCDLKISERAKLEAASFSEFQQKNRLTEQTVQQWVCDVQQWAVTGNNTHYLVFSQFFSQTVI